MEYFEGKPEITPQLIQESIANTWMKYKERRIRTFLNASELTYFLFDNLFRVVKLRPELMEITYDTLIKLNKSEENLDMVQHLENKKREYFNNDNLMY
jgi:hypothetical protein